MLKTTTRIIRAASDKARSAKKAGASDEKEIKAAVDCMLDTVVHWSELYNGFKGGCRDDNDVDALLLLEAPAVQPPTEAPSSPVLAPTDQQLVLSASASPAVEDLPGYSAGYRLGKLDGQVDVMKDTCASMQRRRDDLRALEFNYPPVTFATVKRLQDQCDHLLEQHGRLTCTVSNLRGGVTALLDGWEQAVCVAGRFGWTPPPPLAANTEPETGEHGSDQASDILRDYTSLCFLRKGKSRELSRSHVVEKRMRWLFPVLRVG